MHRRSRQLSRTRLLATALVAATAVAVSGCGEDPDAQTGGSESSGGDDAADLRAAFDGLVEASGADRGYQFSRGTSEVTLAVPSEDGAAVWSWDLDDGEVTEKDGLEATDVSEQASIAFTFDLAEVDVEQVAELSDCVEGALFDYTPVGSQHNFLDVVCGTGFDASREQFYDGEQVESGQLDLTDVETVDTLLAGGLEALGVAEYESITVTFSERGDSFAVFTDEQSATLGGEQCEPVFFVRTVVDGFNGASRSIGCGGDLFVASPLPEESSGEEAISPVWDSAQALDILTRAAGEYLGTDDVVSLQLRQGAPIFDNVDEIYVVGTPDAVTFWSVDGARLEPAAGS